jgi:hypothetical protein
VDYVMWLLATSGVLQQLPPLPLVPDTPAVAAVSVAAPVVPAAAPDSSLPAGPLAPAAWPRLAPFSLAADSTAPQRPRAIEMSEAYHTRLTIHYIASFATLPLFVAEYLIGTRLYRDYPAVTPSQENLRSTHRLVALGVAGLFGVNTVTGAWNLWESRHSPGGLRRYLHAGLMFAADAGFVATGLAGPHGRSRFTSATSTRSLHRTLAITSMGTALASYAMMLIWRN